MFATSFSNVVVVVVIIVCEKCIHRYSASIIDFWCRKLCKHLFVSTEWIESFVAISLHPQHKISSSFTKQFIRFEFSTQLAAARKYSKMHLNQCTRHRCLMDTLQFALHQFNWMAEVKRNRKRQVNKYYTIVENAEKNGKRRRATTSKRMIQTEVKGKKSPEWACKNLVSIT